MSKPFWVYMVETTRGHLYTGVALDPEKRVTEHNSGKRGAKALRGQRPVKLVWRSPFEMTRSEALKLEKRIKKLPPLQKRMLIHDWDVLSEDE